jgi:hypothetical protein
MFNFGHEILSNQCLTVQAILAKRCMYDDTKQFASLNMLHGPNLATGFADCRHK